MKWENTKGGREGVKGRKEEGREKKKEEKNGETSDERKWKEGDGRRRRDERRGEREREICFGRCVYKIANDAQQLLDTTSATGNTHAAINNCLWFRGRECVMEDE